MIYQEQIKVLSKKYKINESVIFREFVQILFLSYLYAESFSNKIFFKGGTAIHLIFHAPRFSEDLDFTVEMKRLDFEKEIAKLFKKIESQENLSFKSRESLAGKRYLITAKFPENDNKVFVNLDFSFREKIWESEKTILQTEYPVIMNSYIKHVSKNELLAEKIRALLRREKGRDVYDLWFLFSQNAGFKMDLLMKKLAYYKDEKFDIGNLNKRIASFSDRALINDLKPFINLSEREKLPQFVKYIKDYLSKKLNSF